MRWLAGETLDEDEAQRLGVKGEDGKWLPSLADAQAIGRTLAAIMTLCRLRGRPFILVFDQVENLDEAEIKALARFCHALLDQAPNLLLVTSGVQRELLDYVERTIIPTAAWERMNQETCQLSLIKSAQARQLLEVRLEPFFESFVSLPDIKARLAEDSIFPVGQRWLDAEFGDAVELKPRHVIAWARKRWQEQIERLRQIGPDEWLRRWRDIGPIVVPPRPIEDVIDEKVEGKIHEQVRRRKLDPSGLPPDAANLCGLVESLLAQCRGEGHDYSLVELSRPKPRIKTHKPTYDLVVRERSPDGREPTTGLTFVVTGSKTSTAGFLRRMQQDPQAPDHVLVVGDERQPVECAATGQDYLAKLEQRGGERFRVQTAVVRPVRAARRPESGRRRSPFRRPRSLAGRGQSATDARRSDRLAPSPGSLPQSRAPPRVVVRERDPLPAPPPPPLDAFEIKKFISAQIALTMGMSSIELAKKYHAQIEGDCAVRMRTSSKC